MSVDEIKKEAAKKGFSLVDVSSHHLTDDEVIDIACLSTGIRREDFWRKTHENTHALARYLVGNFWIQQNRYSHYVIGKKINVSRFVVYHCEKTMADDIKYFKPWQQEAIRNFNRGVEQGMKKKKHEC